MKTQMQEVLRSSSTAIIRNESGAYNMSVVIKIFGHSVKVYLSKITLSAVGCHQSTDNQ